MSRTIPTINTALLTLRAMRPEDFDRFAAIWAMQDVVEHIGVQPRSRSVSWNAFLRNAGHWQITGFGQWGIEDRATKALVGQVGFFYGDRDQGEDFDRWPEAGWVLAPEAQGRGLGRQAAQAAHDWFDRVVTGPLVCQITPDNTPSLRMAEALGYVPLRMVGTQGDQLQLMIRKSPP